MDSSGFFISSSPQLCKEKQASKKEEGFDPNPRVAKVKKPLGLPAIVYCCFTFLYRTRTVLTRARYCMSRVQGPGFFRMQKKKQCLEVSILLSHTTYSTCILRK